MLCHQISYREMFTVSRVLWIPEMCREHSALDRIMELFNWSTRVGCAVSFLYSKSIEWLPISNFFKSLLKSLRALIEKMGLEADLGQWFSILASLAGDGVEEWDRWRCWNDVASQWFFSPSLLFLSSRRHDVKPEVWTLKSGTESPLTVSKR